MADEPKPAKAAKKKRRRKPGEEYVDYVVAVEDWSWTRGKSIGINPHIPFRPPRQIFPETPASHWHDA
jgi:hypothetical protein